MGEANKTLPPTEKKLKDAEKKGNFNYSGDVTQAVVLFFGLGALALCAYRIPTEFDRLLELSLRLITYQNFELAVYEWLKVLFLMVLEFGAIIFITVGLFAWTATICQVGFVFSGAKINKGLTFEQGLNVVSNAKNLFSKQSLATFLMNITKVLIICYVAYYVIKNDKMLIDDIYSCRLDLLCGLAVGAQRALIVLVYIAVAMIPLAALDWFIHRKIYIGQNMMSPDELEREHKDSEGDPHMKSHRKAFAREVIESNEVGRVGKASAVIRNPTHVAIAVRYEPSSMSIPYVIAMGVDDKALKIIEEAEKCGVPSYINVPLARRMVEDCEINNFVPLQYMDGMIKFMHWLSTNHPDRVFDVSEVGQLWSNGGVGNVKR